MGRYKSAIEKLAKMCGEADSKWDCFAIMMRQRIRLRRRRRSERVKSTKLILEYVSFLNSLLAVCYSKFFLRRRTDVTA
ncbi:hypothetical protein PUN28_009770 [Cardiocondyla obscurior]|uniref:Uncharacterized protein n=1 Tax=Cardiocondyla obscurior TaxID=286306 RepID=A0AAW2FKA2_9HYME